MVAVGKKNDDVTRDSWTFDALLLQRAGHWCLKHRIPFVPQLLKGVGLTLFGAVVPPETEFGAGVLLGSRGLGIVIHPRARIGNGVRIGSSVTIGGRSRYYAVPVIEDNVYVGVGARILGPITVGEGSVIGANAVVVHDVPPCSLVAGIPARVLKMDVDVRDYV